MKPSTANDNPDTAHSANGSSEITAKRHEQDGDETLAPQLGVVVGVEEEARRPDAQDRVAGVRMRGDVQAHHRPEAQERGDVPLSVR